MISAYREDGLQIAWDSTSLSRLWECARKYYLYNKIGWTSQDPSPHLLFGIFYHKACERYDHSKAQGKSHDDALRDAIRQALVDSWGWSTDNKYKNRSTLIRTVGWYLDTFSDDPVRTIIFSDGQPAVELSFRFEAPDLKTNDGQPYFLCGHIDRLGVFQDHPWVLDRKTTKSALGDMFMAQFNPHHQLPLYNIAGKIVYHTPVKGVIIDGAQVLIEGSRYQRAMVNYTPRMLDEYMNSVKAVVKMGEYYAKLDYWPMNPTACHHYGGCPFRGICSKDPEVRDVFLRGKFKIDRWDPLKVRGDI